MLGEHAIQAVYRLAECRIALAGAAQRAVAVLPHPARHRAHGRQIEQIEAGASGGEHAWVRGGGGGRGCSGSGHVWLVSVEGVRGTG